MHILHRCSQGRKAKVKAWMFDGKSRASTFKAKATKMSSVICEAKVGLWGLHVWTLSESRWVRHACEYTQNRDKSGHFLNVSRLACGTWKFFMEGFKNYWSGVFAGCEQQFFQCQWHTLQKPAPENWRQPAPENWRRFLAHLSCHLVPNFSGARFWSRIEQCSISWQNLAVTWSEYWVVIGQCSMSLLFLSDLEILFSC